MLFLITGKPRSGKDTVARYLNTLYGAYHTSLARGIYAIAEDYFGMEEKNRDLLIGIGEKMREIDKLVWCKYTLNDLCLKMRHYSHAVISDVRMPHEFEFFMKHVDELSSKSQQQYRLLRVEAPLEVRADREGFNPADDSKPTETALDLVPAHYTLVNSGSLSGLYQQIDAVCASNYIYPIGSV